MCIASLIMPQHPPSQVAASPPRHHTPMVFANQCNVPPTVAQQLFPNLRCAAHQISYSRFNTAPFFTASHLRNYHCSSSALFLSSYLLPLLLVFINLTLIAPTISAPPGNLHAAPPEYRRLVSSLPSDITESWDWQARCSWQPALWKRVMPRGMSFLKALEQRLKLIDTAPPLGVPCFDLGSARLPREV